MSTQPSRDLELFPNPQPSRDYTIRINIPEFTCLCPKTGQPDFATLLLEYIPDQHCVELKSLKMYVWSFRDQGAFHEAVTNEILDDLVSATAPRFMRLSAIFNVRGGIDTTVIAEHRAADWQADTRACQTPIRHSEFIAGDGFYRQRVDISFHHVIQGGIDRPVARQHFHAVETRADNRNIKVTHATLGALVAGMPGTIVLDLQ
jgi:7-cyano-7-deazaguanine reductase